MMDYVLLFLAGLIGLVAGLGSGIFGIGGGSIRIPLLNLVGFTLISAYGMNLMAIPVSSLIGAASQRKNIDRKLGAFMILGGSIGTVLGTLIAFSMSTSALVLAIVFILVSLISVIGMNLNHIAPTTSERLRPSFAALFSSSLAANTLTGMRGGSEGSLFVPILHTLNVDMHRAIATALFAAIFTALVGVLLYWSQQQLLLLEGLVVLTTSGIGSRLGSMVSLRTKPRKLEIGLSIVIIVLSIVPLLKALFM
ncbi:MAG: sulfite exporter TauE/SafE family protein [Candidatus Thorarchaeota archaeon]|nr:sulfite exporter TauE/SafE family protein [Candidatus Thorarchaeota archaeon]